MDTAEKLRERAEQCEQEAAAAATEQVKRRFERLADGWKTVSDAQAWLDGKIPPVERQS
jgi:hypothetical protein